MPRPRQNKMPSRSRENEHEHDGEPIERIPEKGPVHQAPFRKWFW